ncbi:hypothetical protein [Halorarius halobius]|uniref:hypothetical protein n=1 Tax=Halorarius halobius TaxID=2962671 RepID=UPI0020CCF9D5|nr:hypothetical protein [Halorarius halobius]
MSPADRRWRRPRTEAFKPVPSEAWGMSDATKVVVGTVGAAALFSVALIVALAL